EKQLDGMGPERAQAITEQMTKLRAVQEDLSQALALDLGKPTRAAGAAASYEQLVRGEVARVSPLAAERNVAVRVEVAPGVNGARPRSAEKLRQAFLNVLDNAIAAARSEVTVVLSVERDRLLLTVSDDGPGMDEELLPRATEP